MGEDTAPQRGEFQANPEDIEYLEEARKILLEPGYVPRAMITNAELDGLPIPTRFDVVRDNGAQHALNNFMMLFSGAIKPREEPLEELGGRSFADLFRDRDEIVAELGLNIDALIEFARKSRDAHAYGEDSLLEFYREVLPVFEKLVRDKGYSVDSLKM